MWCGLVIDILDFSAVLTKALGCIFGFPVHDYLSALVCSPYAITALYTLLIVFSFTMLSLQWRHNEHDGVSNHQPHDYCLLKLFLRRISKKTPKLRVTGLCGGNSSLTGKFPFQRASNAENVSIWWRHRDIVVVLCLSTWVVVPRSESYEIAGGSSHCMRVFFFFVIFPCLSLFFNL